MYREETDSLGTRQLPAGALYGINTLRGHENFDISPTKIGHDPDLITALATIKLAAARANREIGALDGRRADAIAEACREIREGQHHTHFIVDLMEGSGGTSINMNANEVIANRALQILGQPLGSYDLINPNDHVNLGQSTNDVLPSAIKLAILFRAPRCLSATRALSDSLLRKSVEFRDILKIGRTCMQAAQPMTLGQEFGGYGAGVARAATAIERAINDLMTLPLGGTAIGTGFGAPSGYREAVYRNLSDITGLDLRPPADWFDAMQNADCFSRVSAELRIAAEMMGKIGSDLVILSSGPYSGLGEIRLPAVQSGSSIMPGKINPVVPMMMQQIAFAVIGNDVAVSSAVLAGQLEINHFEPIMASRLLDSIDLMTKGAEIFAQRCIDGISANGERSLESLIRSSALATLFVPKLGYSKVASIVREAEDQGRLFVEMVEELGLITREEILTNLREAALRDG